MYKYRSRRVERERGNSGVEMYKCYVLEYFCVLGLHLGVMIDSTAGCTSLGDKEGR